ncbi:HaeII family restriction endonuclease [Ignavibacteriales bacterium]
MKITEAKEALDSIIRKARVHLYKPIQIAEILHRDRIECDIDLVDLKSYRSLSRKWRDKISMKFLGRSSTSSMRYQDDLFNDNAIPPNVLVALATENKDKNGIVEAYIYYQFRNRFNQMSAGLKYCHLQSVESFQLTEFIELFRKEPGLKRSIDKIYEIVVYSLFSAITEAIQVSITISYDESKRDLLKEFSEFTQKVLSLNEDENNITFPAKLYRVGVTNAADRGLDMYANFGLAIQIKHLSLTEDLAEGIVNSVTSDRIVIVCKDSEQGIITSLLTQIGWRTRIQSIITEQELVLWYEKAFRGKYSKNIGESLLRYIASEIEVEFPATNSEEFDEFISQRKYTGYKDDLWGDF